MNLDIIEAANSTLKFVLSTFPVILVASFATSQLIERGLMEKFSERIKPLLKRLNLSEVTVSSVAVCFVSATAAYSILSQALREKAIDDREVIAASFINSFPSMLTHFYCFLIPFVIPVLGWVGFIYAALRLTVAVVKSLIGLAIARMWNIRKKSEAKQDIKVGSFSTLEIVKNTLPVMIATYFFVQLMLQSSIFSSSLSFLLLDPAVLSVSAIQLINQKASIVVCKSLLESDALSIELAIVALMLGNVVTFSTSYIKHSLPLHVSLFGKLGIKIVVLNGVASLIIGAILIVGVILFL
ncbi:nucleoside recognition protein [Archaeoglobales archaeon]|nr:MAG: nucleoside recognition protein [Archaeoglobales archaeon]